VRACEKRGMMRACQVNVCCVALSYGVVRAE
jgi:hypothetical protein